ncbi:MAG: DUF4153 domain-containing protein [Saprospiraceae bacterium]|nr:DUF4153 domain-containing protein [Saprospiraceae bacterium]
MDFLKRTEIIKAGILEITRRFPLAMFFAVFCTVLLMIQAGRNHAETELLYQWKNVVVAYTAVLLMINLKIIQEVYLLPALRYHLLIIGSLFAIAFYWYLLPTELSDFSFPVAATIGIWILLHLTLTIIPYLNSGSNLALTKYNITLLFNWLKAALFGIILYSALSLAIVALDKLFNVTFGYQIYIRLFFLVAGIFHTFYFLSLYPDDFTLEPESEKKSVFSVLTRFAFIPVVIIYGIILYAYIIKLLMTGSELSTWVSELIIWYIIAGVLSFLFAGYFVKTEENTVYSAFRKWFFILSAPLFVLLLITVWSEIKSKGVEEESYLKALIGSWILITTFLVLILPRYRDKLIPITLMIATIIGFLSGPFSISGAPLRSQQQQLIRKLENIGLIKENTMVVDVSKYYIDSLGQIQNILYYLQSKKELDFLKKYDRNNILPLSSEELEVTTILNKLNIRYPDGMEAQKDFSFTAYNKQATEISDFEKIIPLINNYETTDAPIYGLVTPNGIRILENQDVVAEFDMITAFTAMSENKSSALNEVEMTDNGVKIKLLVQHFYGNFENGKPVISEISAILLYKKI